MKTCRIIFGIVVILALLQSCNMKHVVEVEPVKVEPVHITIDVNIRVDRALDDFFGDIDKAKGKEPNSSRTGLFFNQLG